MGQDSAWLTMNIKKADLLKFDKVLMEGEWEDWWDDKEDNGDGTLWISVDEAWGGWGKELTEMAGAGLTFHGERGHGTTSVISAVVFACFQGDLVITNTLGDNSCPAVAVKPDLQIDQPGLTRAAQYWLRKKEVDQYFTQD